MKKLTKLVNWPLQPIRLELSWDDLEPYHRLGQVSPLNYIRCWVDAFFDHADRVEIEQVRLDQGDRGTGQ